MDAPKSAIIVSNKDLTDSVISVFKRQLFLDEIISGEEFDARLMVDPNYVNAIKITNKKILVLRDLSENFDRSKVDFVVFFKSGLLSIEYNKFGPPGFTLPLDRLYLNQLAFGANSTYTVPRRHCGKGF